jgi:molybdopterin-binding protein
VVLPLLRSSCYSPAVPEYRISDAARLLSVSDDTLRRWADGGRIATTTASDGSGRRVVAGVELARFALEHARQVEPLPVGPVVAESARNRMTGLVTRVLRDGVMAQVELQAGPFRLVSLMSREAADQLGLEPGVLATASVKSTNVVVELADHPSRST